MKNNSMDEVKGKMKNEDLIISVVIPVYNVEKYLRSCLDSILSQSFKQYEIICINDASTDGSYEILKEYATQYCAIKIINNEKRGGSLLQKLRHRCSLR
jgi:glycosyltransferase involved in cell wall biosynthesis